MLVQSLINELKTNVLYYKIPSMNEPKTARNIIQFRQIRNKEYNIQKYIHGHLSIYLLD